jgi:hypothetical protein
MEYWWRNSDRGKQILAGIFLFPSPILSPEASSEKH